MKGYQNGVLCPAVSGEWEVNVLECVDIELEKTICNVLTSPGIGDTISFCIEVCNIGDPSLGLISDVDNLIVEDSWPPDVAFIDYTASSGTFIFNTPFSTWQIPFIASEDAKQSRLELKY